MDAIEAADLAKQVTPGLLDEHGPHPDGASITQWIEDYCADNGIDLNDGDMDLVYNAVRNEISTS